MSAIVRTPVQLDELASYGAGPSAKLGSEARRYVTLLKEDSHDQFTAVMNGWDVAGSGHTLTVERPSCGLPTRGIRRSSATPGSNAGE